MRSLFLIGLSVCCAAISSRAQPTFQKQITPVTGLFCLEQASDGSYWIGTFLGKILRFDPSGNFLNGWDIRLGDTTTTRFVYDLEAAPGGGAWALYDRTNFNNALDDHLILARLDPTGNPVWQTNVYYGEVQHWAHNRLASDPAGNVYVSSVRLNPIGGISTEANRVILSKIGPDGALLWTKAYRNAGFNYPRAMKRLSDGSLLLCGNSQLTTASGFLLRVSPEGDVLWSKRFNRFLFKDVVEMPDGSWVLAATETGPLPQTACLLRMDQAGNLSWGRRLDMPNALNWSPGLARAPNGNLLLFNYETTSNNPVADLISFAENGDFRWARRYDACRNHGITAGIITADGGIAGIRFRAGGHLFLKTDAEGNCAACPARDVNLPLVPVDDIPLPSIWESDTWPAAPVASSLFFPYQASAEPFCGQEKPVTEMTLTDDTLCMLQTLGAAASGPGQADQYRWSFPGGLPAQLSGSAAVNGIRYDAPGAVQVLLEAITGFCRDSFFAQLIVKPGPEAIHLGPDTTLCGLPGRIALNATTPGALEYTWNDGVMEPMREVTASGQYAVSAAGNGCTVSDTVKVQILEQLQVSLGADTTLCGKDSIWLDGTAAGAERYRWNDGVESPRRLVYESGFYAVTAYRAGCLGSDFISVGLFPRPPALPADTVVCEDEPLVLSVGESLEGDIYWNNQPGLATLSFDSSGVVRRRVEYRHCRFDDTVVVARVPCRNGFTLYAPNAFSPNSDGRNDFFELSGADLEVLELQIFDRWGSRLLQEKSTAGNARWDGRVNGSIAPVGVYVWMARLRQRGREGWEVGEALLSGQ